MNRFLPNTVIPTDFILDSDEAQAELNKRGWSIGHAAIDGTHQVSGHKQDARIVANAPTELDAWLLACVKANEQEQLSLMLGWELEVKQSTRQQGKAVCWLVTSYNFMVSRRTASFTWEAAATFVNVHSGVKCSIV